MTALLPTRVSIYDFLYQDTQPIHAVLADFGRISLPQARILVENGIQAITGAIIAYNQNEGSEAVLKKLLNRSQVKELRKHNAFNFMTMKTAMQYGPNTIDALFPTTDIQKNVAQRIAKLASLRTQTVRELLGALTLLCLRELAILADFAQLDANEVNEWICQQSQFLKLSRSQAALNTGETKHPDNNACDVDSYRIPDFDLKWLELTHCELTESQTENQNAQMPHYAKVIGRAAATQNDTTTGSPNLVTDSKQLIVDNANKNDVLTFCSIDNISLPYQRWLLQLAKISDIYLSRNRLKIAPEPVQAPSRPLVNFGFKDNVKASNTTNPTTKKPEEPVQNKPFWKNPVLIILVIVLGTLTLIAVGKHKYKKAQAADQSSEILSDTVSTPLKSVNTLKSVDNNNSHG